jgi:phosphatidylinositol glycan class Z
MQLTQGAEAL